MRSFPVFPVLFVVACGAEEPFQDGASSTCRSGWTEAWSVDNGHGDIVASAVSPSGRVALASEDGTVKIWEISDPSGPSDTLGGMYGAEWAVGQATTLAFGPDEQLAVGTDAGEVAVFDVQGIQLFRVETVNEMGTHGDRLIQDLAWSPDGTTLVAVDDHYSGNPQRLDARTGALLGLLPTRLWGTDAVTFFDDDTVILAGDWYSVPTVEVADVTATEPGPFWMTEEAMSHTVSAVHLDGEELVVSIGGNTSVGLDGDAYWATVDLGTLADSELVPATSVSSHIVALEDELLALTESGPVTLDQDLTETPVLDADLVGLAVHEGTVVGASAEGHLRLYSCE